ncbi:zinc finger protein 585A-like [Palaemon carinicauda]|uniref:zinc finger protein 585A-like n=1 Tax=Palaemon carinicauda TaxID=392227 RepID=UPI0035B658FF
MEDSDGVSSGGVPDITQFLSVCMAEDDVVNGDEDCVVGVEEEAELSDLNEEPRDETEYKEDDVMVKVEEPIHSDYEEDPEKYNYCMAVQYNDEFRTMLENSFMIKQEDEVFKLSGKECLVCGKTVSRSKMKVHMRTHTGEKPYECDVCNKRFARSDKLITHKRIHSGEKPHVCFCGKQFRRLDHLKDHIKTHDLNDADRDALLEKARNCQFNGNVRKAVTTQVRPPGAFTCTECGMSFTQSYKFKRHLRVHTGEKPYVCFCGNKYTRSEGLRRHQLNFHGLDKNNCVVGEVPIRLFPEVILQVDQQLPGNVELNAPGSLETLVKAEHDETDAELSHEVVLERVDGIEGSESEGGYNNLGEADLDDSMSQSGDLSNKDCPICGKSVSRSKIKVHLRTHTGEKPFQCDICNKSFARSDKLTCHKRIHTGEKPYICFCGKRFSRIDHMKMHAAIHKVDGNRLDVMLEEARNKDLISRGLPLPIHSTSPFTCSYCGVTFTQSYKYKRHLRVHTGEKPYECFCGSRYSRSERLRRHQIKCHGFPEKIVSRNGVSTNVMPEVLLQVKEPVSGVSFEVNEAGMLEATNCNAQPEVKSEMGVNIGSAIPPPSFGTLADIEHVMREVIVEQVSQPKPKPVKESGVHCCEFCPKTFKKAHKLGLHRRIHTGEKPHLCSSCGKAFARRDHMLKHMNIHLKRRKFSLMNAANAGAEGQNLFANSSNVEGEEDLRSCENITDTEVEEHNSSVDDAKMDGNPDEEDGDSEREKMQGEESDTTENKEGDATQIKTEGKELHVCNICGHAFRKVYNLQSHMQIHTERTLFECGVCSKQFKVKKNYEAHLLNHEQQMDLSEEIIERSDLKKARSQRAQCTICGKWLVSMSSLETHMRSHTGERPFQCNVCEHAFIRKSDMLRHMKSHTGERPYECIHCLTTFSRKDKLAFHLKKHEEST